jgi:hypothetical protein
MQVNYYVSSGSELDSNKPTALYYSSFTSNENVSRIHRMPGESQGQFRHSNDKQKHPCTPPGIKPQPTNPHFTD